LGAVLVGCGGVPCRRKKKKTDYFEGQIKRDEEGEIDINTGKMKNLPLPRSSSTLEKKKNHCGRKGEKRKKSRLSDSKRRIIL